MRKKAILALLLVLVALAALAACQPTPEEEVVQNRKDGTLEQVITATAAPTYAPEEKYAAPEKWAEELEFRGEKIYIDADIEVPDGNAFEVLTITINEFDKENALDMAQCLLGENLELRMQERSYDELLVDLQDKQKGWFVDLDEETGEAIWEPYEGQEEEIRELKELLAQTSPEESFVTLDKKIDFPVGTVLLKTEEGERWYWKCFPQGFYLWKNRKSLIQWESVVMDGNAYPGEKGHALEVTGITEEEAIEKAKAFIAPLQRAEMQVAEVEKARILENYTYNVLSTGYYIKFVGNPANTIPCLYLNYSGNHALHFSEDSDMEYGVHWVQEEMDIFVSEEGVESFSWSFRKKVVGVANENATLLPFEQIQERIRTLLEYGVREGNNNPIHITRIVLGSAIQRVANQGDEAFMVPTWMVFFTTDWDMEEKLQDSLLMISALDGSYISLWG